jgi:3-dehydroquinate dehydratase type I
MLTKQPLLATYRSKPHLGQGDLTARDDKGWKWRTRCLDGGFDLIDIELDEPGLEERIAEVHEKGAKVVLSHHDVEGDASLPEAMDRALETKADVIKIIGMGRGAQDFATQRALYRDAADRTLICFFMGPEHAGTRVLSMVYGAPFTFLTLQSEHAIAPGQLTARDVDEIYKPHDVPHEGWRLFAVIGSPVGHSHSPEFHNPRLNVQNPANLFLPLPCADDQDFAILEDTFPELCGLAVTKPMKEPAFKRADSFLDPDSAKLGALNTLVFEEGKAKGANTDLLAMIEILRDLGNKGPIRILGYGGLGKAVVRACATLGLTAEICNRTPGRIADLPKGVTEIPWEDRHREGVVMIVQATSAGMAPNIGGSPLDHIPGTAKYLIETIYNPLETKLTQMARAAGLRIYDGMELFDRQARIQNRVFLAAE